MYKLIVVLSAFFCVLLSSCVTNKAYTKEMKDNLKLMFKLDQDCQNYDMTRINDKKYVDSMSINQDRIMKNNSLVVKEYFKKYGFPGLRQNDEKTAVYFWTIVQHTDEDVQFQNKVLKAMKKHLKNKNASAQNYAYLYDRVCKNLGEKQLYGTQVGRNGWDIVPEPALEFPDKVDDLRKEMGLEPLKVYYETFKD